MSRISSTQKIKLLMVVAVSTLLALALHALVPSNVNEIDFTGFLVQKIGFPLTATLYFVVLYTHCIWVYAKFAKRFNRSIYQAAVIFGAVFAGLYIMGMQEVIVEGSPYSSWGIDFIKFQFYIGISDGLAVMALFILAAAIIRPRKSIYTNNVISTGNWITLISVATGFIIQRTLRNHFDLITNNLMTYPNQTYIWTLLFGLVLGIGVVSLRPFFIQKNLLKYAYKISFLGLGLNWMIYNSFIGLVFQGELIPMLQRSFVDVIVLYLSVVFSEGLRKMIIKNDSF